MTDLENKENIKTENTEPKKDKPEEKKEEKSLDRVLISSKKKFFWLIILVTVFAPICGVFASIFCLTEDALKKDGKKLLIISILWGIVFYYIGYLTFRF